RRDQLTALVLGAEMGGVGIVLVALEAVVVLALIEVLALETVHVVAELPDRLQGLGVVGLDAQEVEVAARRLRGGRPRAGGRRVRSSGDRRGRARWSHRLSPFICAGWRPPPCP